MTPTLTTLPFHATPHHPSVLGRGPYPDRPDVWSLDLGEPRTDGLFDDPSHVVHGLADQVAAELTIRDERPRMVRIGTGADPFQPSADVQREVGRVVRLLAERGIVAWLNTRGTPLPDRLDTLEHCRDHVRVTVSLTTADAALQRVLEPGAASFVARLELIAELQRRQIPLEVNLDPLLPGLTDTRDRLWTLLDSLAEIGVRQITAGYLVLRPGARDELRAALDPLGLADVVLGAYADGPVFRDGPNPAAQYLSKAKRQRGYATLMAVAGDFGITAKLSSLANPDFRPPAVAARPRSLVQMLRSSSRTVRAKGA